MVQTSILNKLDSKDFEETKQVLIESYSQYERLLGSAEAYNEYIESIRKSLDNESIEQVFIAKDEDKIIGTLQLFKDATKAYQLKDFDAQEPFIRLLAVSPLARHKGVARSLIDETIAYLKSNGRTSVYLHTSKIMADAVRLYERYGFERYTPFDFKKNGQLVTCYHLKF